MNWILKNPFVLSANLHAGAIMVSYPYDDSPKDIERGDYSATSDDRMFRYLSLTYSFNHPFMHKNFKCKNGDNYPKGISNGAFWYDKQGTMKVN